MLWHGSDRIFSKFELSTAGRTDRASNGALGIWCVYDNALRTARGFAGENGALYEIEEPSGKTYNMPIRALARHHAAAGRLDDDAAQAAYYDRIRLEMIQAGYERINIIEGHGGADMCVLLEPEKIRIVSREITIIPHDRLPAVLGLDRGEIISDDEFAKYHSENRLRLMNALNRHISDMGVDDLAADGSRNFSKRVGELNRRRAPFYDALTRLTETHEQIWRDEWERIKASMADADIPVPESVDDDLPEPAY